MSVIDQVGSYYFFWSCTSPSTEFGQPLGRGSATALLRKLAADPMNMTALRSILSKNSNYLQTSYLSNDEVVDVLSTHLVSGRLLSRPVKTVKTAPVTIPTIQEKVMAAAHVKPAEDKPKHWIEIELLDEAGSPVYGVKYTIKTPDGSVKKGKLDEHGRGFVRNIPGGNCIISFSELDQEAWSLA